GKLSVIGENSKRLAEGRVLQPATPGSDELAVLDQEFHRMADSIVAARIKARTAVDNSLDLIFSLASDGTFRSVNPAALKILGFKPTELLNRSYIDIVKKQDRERVVEQLKLARAGQRIAAIEHTAIRKGSDEVELQLTAQWSTEDQSLFCVVHDVSEQHRLKRQREEFTENITRALREPLHSLTASLSALRNSELTGEQEREQLQSARSSAQPVLNLISNLLQLEKIQAGMIKLSLSKEPISALIEDATESLVDAAELNDVAINWQAGDQIVNVDGQAIHDVLVALVKNAIANSPPRGQINIESFYDGMVVIQITDNGPKWTIDDFDPFALAKKANTGETEGRQRKHQGTNLELAICKTSVEAHKGSITIGSDSIAAASISIRLPGFESTSGEKA
ncbi:MAG TPA: PAS domain S-box protein, partial [Chroococcales cyanobacterium]